jgi:hypothetical protein
MIASVGDFSGCVWDTLSRFNLTRSYTMNAINNKVINAYSNFLASGTSFGEAMQKLASQGDMTYETKQALADITAKHFKCHTKINNRGDIGFYQDAECKVRHDAARKCWQRNVAVWFKSAKPAVRKQVDKVQATATRLQKQLNKKDLARLIKLLSA